MSALNASVIQTESNEAREKWGERLLLECRVGKNCSRWAENGSTCHYVCVGSRRRTWLLSSRYYDRSHGQRRWRRTTGALDLISHTKTDRPTTTVEGEWRAIVNTDPYMKWVASSFGLSKIDLSLSKMSCWKGLCRLSLVRQLPQFQLRS